MQTVVETPGYLAAAKAAGISDAVRYDIVSAIGFEPDLGELERVDYANSGLRGRVAAKSGGYRVLSYYISAAFPVFLIGVFAKNQKENMSPAERAAIAKRLKTMSESYAKKADLR